MDGIKVEVETKEEGVEDHVTYRFLDVCVKEETDEEVAASLEIVVKSEEDEGIDAVEALLQTSLNTGEAQCNIVQRHYSEFELNDMGMETFETMPFTRQNSEEGQFFDAPRHLSEFELNDGIIDHGITEPAMKSSWTVESIPLVDNEINSVKSEINDELSDLDIIQQSSRSAGIPQDDRSHLNDKTGTNCGKREKHTRSLTERDLNEDDEEFENMFQNPLSKEQHRSGTLIPYTCISFPQTSDNDDESAASSVDYPLCNQDYLSQAQEAFVNHIENPILGPSTDISEKPAPLYERLTGEQEYSSKQEHICLTSIPSLSLQETVGASGESNSLNKYPKGNREILSRKRQTPVTSIRDASLHETAEVGKESWRLYKCPLCKKECQSEKDHMCCLIISAGENPVKHFKVSGNKQDGCSVKQLVEKRLDPMSRQNAAVADKPSKKLSVNLHLTAEKMEKPFHCNTCNVGFDEMSELTTHLKLHANQCPVCNKFLPNAFTYREHIRTHVNGISVSDFECPICPRHFISITSLTLHMRTHGGSLRPKSHECPTCLKRFMSPHHLRDHIRTHTGEKPFQCPICHKGFSQKSSVKKHLHTHTNQKLAQCTVCNKKFLQKSKVLAETWDTGEPYKCVDCVKFIKDTRKGIPLETKRKRRKLDIPVI